MNVPAPRMHPALLTAALSVSAFALAGIGALTGAIPFGKAAAPAPAVAQAAATPTHATLAAPRAVRRAVRPASTAGGPDIEVTRAEPGYNVRTAASAPAACRDCGVVESVREVTQPGEASGLGAVAGGVVGGVLGNQVGAGRGRDAMTVLGAIGGAFAGHQIEKSQKKTTHYEIVVRYDDGTTQVLTQDAPPAWREGQRVRVSNGMLNPAGV